MPLFSSQKRLRIPDPTQPAAQPGEAATSLLRRYRPLETRAQGGFGSVEICLDARLQRRVAIKRIPLASSEMSFEHATVAEALSEARTASMLQHPNIVSVIDFTFDAAYAYLVMEYVDGMSLEEFLRHVEGNSLTYDEAAAIADGLTRALAHAHENGVLHLDIKPANVLIDKSGHVKLADFGMATLASAAGFGGARGGTLGYMAPEQLLGQTVDERSDIFSLAAVLYEALCAKAPFRAATPQDSLARIEAGVVAPSTLLPTITQGAQTALLCALSPNAKDRPCQVEAFGDAFLEGLGTPRAGERSLARIITRLTQDDEPLQESEAEQTPRPERDCAQGWLGTLYPRARTYLQAGIAGISTACIAWHLLGASGPLAPLAHLVVALAVGGAAALAPQIGSALIICGLIFVVANNTPLLGALPVLALVISLGSAWWLAWGRTSRLSSTALCATCSCLLFLPAASVAAPLTAALTGWLLPPAAAAGVAGVGMVMGTWIRSSVFAGGALSISQAAAAVLSPSAILSMLAGIGGAWLVSWALTRAWTHYEEHESHSLFILVPLLGTILGIATGFICVYIGNPMEIAPWTVGSPLAQIAIGVLSSIMTYMYVYLFGYEKNQAEADRS